MKPQSMTLGLKAIVNIYLDVILYMILTEIFKGVIPALLHPSLGLLRS